MKTGKLGKDLVKKYEGLRLKAYKCPANVWTIGYGHTGADVFENLEITAEKADELLAQDLGRFEKAVMKLVTTNIGQNQFDALVSFTYNLGEGNLKSSTLLKKINVNKEDPAIKTEFGKWVNAGGQKLAGLVKRREEEAVLYFLKTE